MPGKKGGRGGAPNDDQEDLAAQIRGNPQMLAALQQLQEDSEENLQEPLPLEVSKRVNALKNLQVKHAALEQQFEKELLDLELKYLALHTPLYQKRSTIISGEYEPTEEESKFQEDDEAEEEPAKPSENPVKGIPHFWSTALQNHPYIAGIIEEHDLPILEHLTDVTVEYFKEPETGYHLKFKFSPNEYFKETELVKTYILSYELEENSLLFDGPSYERASGTAITWNEGKNVTVRTEKKKQKKKGGKDAGKTRTITRQVKQPSFFDFFAPPTTPEGEADEESEEYQEIQQRLSMDFELGDIIKEKILPLAVLWFTGQAAMEEDDDDYGEDYGEDDEDDDEGQDDDDDDDEPPPPKGGKGKGAQGGAAKPGQPANPECKQS